MLKHALNHSAAELVHAHFIDASFERINNELNLIRMNLLYDLLDNMVTVGIFDAVDYLWLDLFDHLFLKRGRQDIESLLDHSASILIAGQRIDTPLQVIEELLPLIRRAELEHFLHDVVPEDVLHKSVGVRLPSQEVLAAYDFRKEHLLLIFIGLFQPLLHKARALLVKRTLDKVAA